MSRQAAIRVGLACAVLLGACDSSEDNATPGTIAPSSTTAAPRVDDGVLRIGVLLPSSGPGGSIMQSARAAVRAAVMLANENGGVNGKDVVLLVRDEGADATTAAVVLEQLLASNVDAIIGPASSNTTIALAPTIIDAGVAACSPSASALSLDDFPDNGLFFRTIPSDSLQAEAMAKVIEQTGVTSAAIAYVDDGYGRPLERVLQVRLRSRGITVSSSVAFSVDDAGYVTEAERLVSSGKGAIALIGDQEAGSRMLAALADATSNEPRDIVVNDALRQPWSLSLLGSVTAETRARIVGVSPAVLTANEELLAQVVAQDPAATGLFAGQAYDCANVFMLAAMKTGSTQPVTIAAAVPDISSVGSSCATFERCAVLLAEDRSIDYEGADGILAIGADGDLITARYEQFSFDDNGRDVTLQTIAVSSFGTTLGS
ncbi:MAG: ABC transporter substrate-binding protein [Ilumatobacteraceae bacterium]